MSNLSKSKTDLQNQFDLFIFDLSDMLEKFASDTLRMGYKFDYLINSIPVLETFITNNKLNIDSPFYIPICSYLGEVVRKNWGGKWICSLDEKSNSLFYGYPVIYGHSKFDVQFSPFHSVKTYMIRPRPNHFIRAIESQVAPKTVDLTDIPLDE